MPVDSFEASVETGRDEDQQDSSVLKGAETVNVPNLRVVCRG